MPQCIAKSEEGNHVRDVSRFYLKLHGSLNRCLSYKVSYPRFLITNADVNTEGVWRCMFISKEEYANVKCAEVYLAIVILLIYIAELLNR